jgi:hypothetical protein
LLRGLWATAISESNLNAEAVGDGGDSVGLLQFRSAVWTELGAGELPERLEPAAQGRAAVRYLGRAARPWALVAPMGGLEAWRILWTRGVEMSAPPDLEAWRARYLSDESLARRAWAAPPTVYYLAWIPTFFLWQTPLTLVMGAVFGASTPRRRR